MSAGTVIALILIIFIIIIGALLIGALVFYFSYPQQFEDLMDRWFGTIVSVVSPKTPSQPIDNPKSPTDRRPKANPKSLTSNQLPSSSKSNAKNLKDSNKPEVQRVDTDEYIIGVGQSTIPDPAMIDNKESLTNL